MVLDIDRVNMGLKVGWELLFEAGRLRGSTFLFLLLPGQVLKYFQFLMSCLIFPKSHFHVIGHMNTPPLPYYTLIYLSSILFSPFL